TTSPSGGNEDGIMTSHHRRLISPRRGVALLIAAGIVAAAVPAIVAHSGDSLQSPLTASPFSPIDGTIDAASGPERSGAAAGCNSMKLYSVRTATSLYLAVDGPD